MVTERLTAESNRQALLRAIETREARVCVIGLGYVGLPLGVEFAEAGFTVTGIDLDPRKIDTLARGESYIEDVPTAQVAPLVKEGRFSATSVFSALAQADAVIICVPTPLRKTKEPDISYIVSAAERIAEYLRPGQLVVLESTTYPGTTDEVLLPMFERAGLTVGEDFFLAFSPERVDPGSDRFKTRNIPKIVGGITAACGEAARALYSQVIEHVHPVSSAKVAETAKLLENTFRSVNIGLVNEMAMICRHLNVDVWEVIDAAATKPFGFMAHFPGPGIGGHCIPLDPHYLAWKARLSGYEAKFIGLADEVNTAMPRHVIGLISDALNEDRKCLNGSRLLVLGVAYKKDVSDCRESPALEIIEMLQKRGARVEYHDPHVPVVRLDGHSHESVELTDTALSEADAAIVLTNHSAFDYERVGREARLVVDTRNAMKHVAAPRARVVKI
jgi:UDP-N-acetyl-D-glucosamine dehydrogenase